MFCILAFRVPDHLVRVAAKSNVARLAAPLQNQLPTDDLSRNEIRLLRDTRECHHSERCAGMEPRKEMENKKVLISSKVLVEAVE
jgi:hypothetical protein